jgi:hypothetical protein
MGHRVKLIPPQYVKTFVKRSKNDRNDAEAIGEAASRPAMRTVPLKTTEEQAATIIVKHREMLVAQRTQAINALRGHAAVAPQFTLLHLSAVVTTFLTGSPTTSSDPAGCRVSSILA